MQLVLSKRDRADAGRVILARYLDVHGPTTGTDLAAALGLSLEVFWSRIDHSWFVITGKGWVLTARGRSEGLPATRAPAADLASMPGLADAMSVDEVFDPIALETSPVLLPAARSRVQHRRLARPLL